MTAFPQHYPAIYSSKWTPLLTSPLRSQLPSPGSQISSDPQLQYGDINCPPTAIAQIQFASAWDIDISVSCLGFSRAFSGAMIASRDNTTWVRNMSYCSWAYYPEIGDLEWGDEFTISASIVTAPTYDASRGEWVPISSSGLGVYAREYHGGDDETTEGGAGISYLPQPPNPSALLVVVNGIYIDTARTEDHDATGHIIMTPTAWISPV